MNKTNEILDIAADAFEEIGPVKAIKKVWDKITERRLGSLFKKCAEQIEGEGTLEEKFKRKLYEYTQTDFGQDTVYGMVTKALFTDSQWCCRILGIILGKAMRQNRSLNFEERIISEALKSMNDSDLRLLVDISNTIHKIPVPEKIITDVKGDQNKLKEKLHQNSVHIKDFYQNRLIKGNIDESFFIVERLKALHILRCTANYNGWAMSSTDGLLKINKISSDLAELAIKTK